MPHCDPDKKRKPNGSNKQDSGNKAQKAELPDELKNISGLKMNTEAGEVLLAIQLQERLQVRQSRKIVSSRAPCLHALPEESLSAGMQGVTT